MLENLNPIYSKNPMWPYIKRLGEYQKMDLIPVADIQNTLHDMDQLNQQILDGTHKVHFGDKGKIREFNAMINNLIKGVRNDLANEYTESDGHYIKKPK